MKCHQCNSQIDLNEYPIIYVEDVDDTGKYRLMLYVVCRNCRAIHYIVLGQGNWKLADKRAAKGVPVSWV